MHPGSNTKSSQVLMYQAIFTSLRKEQNPDNHCDCIGEGVIVTDVRDQERNGDLLIQSLELCCTETAPSSGMSQMTDSNPAAILSCMLHWWRRLSQNGMTMTENGGTCSRSHECNGFLYRQSLASPCPPENHRNSRDITADENNLSFTDSNRPLF